jgi:hypothetical protein
MMVSAAVASRISGIRSETLIGHIENGLLPAERRGARWYVELDDLFYHCQEQWERGRVIMSPPDMDAFNHRAAYFTGTKDEWRSESEPNARLEKNHE